MQMKSPLQIKSIVKALSDVVLPAIDPNNKPAQEQARLAIGMLSLMATQLPLQFRFDCDELSRLIGLSRELAATTRGGTFTSGAVAAATEAADHAAAVLQGAQSSPDDLQRCIRALRAATGQVVTQVHVDGAVDCRATVSRCVLAESRAQLLRDRSWLLMQGWETDPAAVPAIDGLI